MVNTREGLATQGLPRLDYAEVLGLTRQRRRAAAEPDATRVGAAIGALGKAHNASLELAGMINTVRSQLTRGQAFKNGEG